MLILPNDDTSLDDSTWLFTQVTHTPRGLTIGVREFYSVDHPDLALTEITPSYGATRIRSGIGGGFYPRTNAALIRLSAVTTKCEIWQDETPFFLARDGDIWVHNRSRRAQAPFEISAEQIAEHKSLDRAVTCLLSALRQDLSSAPPIIWSRFPDNFPLRQEAELELAKFHEEITITAPQTRKFWPHNP